MDFFTVIEGRRSIRRYKDVPVDRELVEKILEAGRRAPTAVNYQPFRVHVVSTKGREAELLKVYANEWMVGAPYVLLMCSLSSEAWSRSDGKNYADIDATIAFDHMILAAQSMGLGTCWIAAFDPAEVRKVFQLRTEEEPIALTPLGYAEESPSQRKRKKVDELVVWVEQTKPQ